MPLSGLRRRVLLAGPGPVALLPSDPPRGGAGRARLVRSRSVGVEQVGPWAVEQLRLPALLADVGVNGALRAAAVGSLVGRLAQPASERATHRWLQVRSGVGELLVRRPRISWTRIKGESDVQGGWENGSVEEREWTWVGTDEGSPEGDWSRCRRRGRGRSLGPGAAVERGPEAGGCAAAAARRVVDDVLSREVGVEIYRLEAWKARALAGLELGLKAQAGEPLAAELDAAKRHIGELSMDNELLRERARAAERRLPLPMRRSRR